MLTMQSFREPLLADEVLTPASLPPSATSLTTRGRSLFNEVLMAMRTRHRACSNSPGTIAIMYVLKKGKITIALLMLLCEKNFVYTTMNVSNLIIF